MAPAAVRSEGNVNSPDAPDIAVPSLADGRYLTSQLSSCLVARTKFSTHSAVIEQLFFDIKNGGKKLVTAQYTEIG